MQIYSLMFNKYIMSYLQAYSTSHLRIKTINNHTLMGMNIFGFLLSFVIFQTS